MKRGFKPLLLAAALLCAAFTGARAQDGSSFVWAQLRYGTGWDPYPTAWDEISEYLKNTTSVPFVPQRSVVALEDPALFSLPFLVLTGKDAPPDLSDARAQVLRDYLANGGLLWIDDASGDEDGSFDRWVRRSMAKVLPESSFEVLPSTHAIFRSFYLLRSIGGRVLVQPSIEGINLQDRTAVIYTRNDEEGAWVKDSLGNYLYPCTPGGEGQRTAGRFLTVNILFYALTGSYKLDAVHQPFILEKLRSYNP